MAPRELGEQERRNLGNVGEGLVVQRRQARDHGEGVARRDIQLRVLGPEVTSHGRRVPRLVVRALVKPDRKRLDRTLTLGLHEGDDGGRVDPSGQEGPERDVRLHPEPHRVPEQRIELRDRFIVRTGEWLGGAPLRDLAGGPVCNGHRVQVGLVCRDAEQRPRRKLEDAAIDREWRRHITVLEEERDRVGVHTRPEGRVRPQRLELRPEQQRSARPAVIERLFASPIAHEVHRAALTVPECEREHAVEALHRGADLPLAHRRQQHLRVGAAPKPMTQRRELEPQGAEVVNLPVERDHVTAARRLHGLLPQRGQVQDREAPMPERDPGGRIAPHAAVVGTAVLEHGRHGAENAQRTLFAQTARVVVSRDATHISRWPPLRPQLAHPLCYEALCPGAS